MRLAEEGAKVVVADIIDTASTVKEIEDKGGAAIGLHVDVSSEEDTKRMAEETIAKFGRIDILVNNAAVFYGLKDISDKALKPLQFSKEVADVILTALVSGAISIISLKEVADVIRL